MIGMIPTADDDTPPPDLLAPDDPFLADLVARTLAPYAARLSPEALADMRAQLIVTATTHPASMRALLRARNAPRVERSGAREKPGAAVHPAKKERAR
jgi:hypothetical protein